MFKKSSYRYFFLSLLFLFTIGTSAFAQDTFPYTAGKSYIETNIHDLKYDAGKDALIFTFQLRKGKDYGVNGRLLAANIRFNIYLEPGVTIDRPGIKFIGEDESAAYGMAQYNMGITNVTLPTTAFGAEHIITPAPDAGYTAKAFGITVQRGADKVGRDIPDDFVSFMDIIIPITSSVKPTDLTKVIVRTEPNHVLDRTDTGSFWSTYATSERQGFRPSEWTGEEEKCPRYAIWTSGAINFVDKTDWHNSNNWFTYDENGNRIEDLIPGDCTEVYIPGSLTIFPTMKAAGECQDIYFLPGAQIGQIQLLTYEKAHVQMDYGLFTARNSINDNDTFITAIVNAVDQSAITAARLAFANGKSSGALTRHRWYMMSAPLKDMVSGDFGFGGYPLTFMFKFDRTATDPGTYPEGQWTKTYRALNEPLTNEGYVFWMNEYRDQMMYRESGTDDSGTTYYGIKEVNGILEFPYYEDPDMVRARRTQSTTGNSSSFGYIWDTNNSDDPLNLGDIIPEGDKPADVATRNKAYRFIAEGSDDKIPAEFTVALKNSEPCYTLVGNPFMSSIDFYKFYLDNASVIEPNYKIFTTMGASNNFSQIDYADYSNPIATGPVILDGLIAPMQSFLVQTKVANATLKFKAENITTTTTALVNILKAPEAPEENVLRISSFINESNSETVIRNLEGSTDSYDAYDDRFKLFSPDPSQPEIYSIVDNYPVSINTIESNNITIPLGIRTQSLGEIMLSFRGMNYYDAKIFLIDIEKDETIDITGFQSLAYSFNNQTTGVSEGRFFIKFVPAGEDIDNPITEKVQAYICDKGISCIASETNFLKQVYVYNAQGQILYHDTKVENSYHLAEMNIERGQVYMVKLVTEKGVEIIKLMK